MFRKAYLLAATMSVAVPSVGLAAQTQNTDLATAFSARPQVLDASMSPDGKKVALVMPGKGRATGVVILDVANGTLKPIYGVDGSGEQLSGCSWVGASRVACTLWGVMAADYGLQTYSGVLAMDDNGANQKLLSRRQRLHEMYMNTRGGEIIDLLPDEDGSVLMQRSYAPKMSTGTIVKVNQEGLGVDRVSTRDGSSKPVVQPQATAVDYITDGHGTVRIRAVQGFNESGYSTGVTSFLYRDSSSSAWKPLSDYSSLRRSGFVPAAVDREKNVAYGFETVGGYDALVSVKLDGSNAKSVLLRHAGVDVGGLIRLGRAQRVVGASYTTDRTHAEYFDPSIRSLKEKLERAIGGGKEVAIVDTSADERKAIVWAGSDVDPGSFYFLDRDTNQMGLITKVSPEVEGIGLSQVRSVSYKAKDGTVIPAYLTIPRGSSGKNLPAIVMPHGGPESRDYWGYDQLTQFFVARGFAVIQPQYRGSAGFGSAWYQQNGFRGWRTSIGDVNDAAHYLVSEGIADPSKLVIFGWSYGGYAALQANVLEPGLFKAVVAVAPVTDLPSLAGSARDQTNYLVQKQFLGTGPTAIEGSPAQNAAKIGAPVLMFHGTYDVNVPVAQSRLMDAKLHAVGARSRLVIFEKLEHSLRDPAALRQVMQESADFLAAAGK